MPDSGVKLRPDPFGVRSNTGDQAPRTDVVVADDRRRRPRRVVKTRRRPTRETRRRAFPRSVGYQIVAGDHRQETRTSAGVSPFNRQRTGSRRQLDDLRLSPVAGRRGDGGVEGLRDSVGVQADEDVVACRVKVFYY